jgi:hypothetical protein
MIHNPAKNQQEHRKRRLLRRGEEKHERVRFVAAEVS